MKKRMMSYFIGFAAAVFVAGSVGCSGSDREDKNTKEQEKVKPAVAYMVAHTANAKDIDSSVPIVQDTMVDCAVDYGHAFIVRVDGEPELVLSENLDIPSQFKNASEERLTRDAHKKATDLLAVLDGVNAVHPEVDYLEGLRCAAASLRSLDSSYTSRSIVCCGTGMGTAGYMNCTNNLISAEPEVILNMLQEKEALPDLNGIVVYWIGMGQTMMPQEKLSPKQLKNLEDIWQAIIEAAGGEFIVNDYIAVTNENTQMQERPPVSVVELPGETPWVFNTETLTDKEEEEPFEQPMILGEKQVEFVGDQSEYLYPENAVETIRPIAEYLIGHKSVKLLLIGATAGDITNDFTLSLSSERAQAVQDTLISLGVEGERITAIGMGSDDPWHIKNAGYESEASSSNRHVVLLDINSEQAQKILKDMKERVG